MSVDQLLWVVWNAKPWWLPRFIWRRLCTLVEVQIKTSYQVSIPWPPTKKAGEDAQKLLKDLPDMEF